MITKTVELPTIKCLRCNWSWIPRINPTSIKVCPKCHNPYWNEMKELKKRKVVAQ